MLTENIVKTRKKTYAVWSRAFGELAGFIAAGVLKGAVIGAASGAAIGAGTGAISHRVSTGSWEGAGMAALEGGADGFMYGAITGAVTGGAGRTTQALRSTNVTTRSLPRTSKPMTSKNLIRNGKIEQKRFYDFRGRAKWDIDFSAHNNPLKHTNPHAHSWSFFNPSLRSGALNGFRWW